MFIIPQGEHSQPIEKIFLFEDMYHNKKGMLKKIAVICQPLNSLCYSF